VGQHVRMSKSTVAAHHLPSVTEVGPGSPAAWRRGLGALMEGCAEHDGVASFNEQTRLEVYEDGGHPWTGFACAIDGELRGYAHLSHTGHRACPWLIEAAVHPHFRRKGIGAILVRQALQAAAGRGGGPVLLWGHGDGAGSRALAAALGLTGKRRLECWARAVSHEVEQPVPPEGIRFRSFRPGHDEGRWLSANAEIFAEHPEQGHWDAHDLAARERSAWFDPSGFLLAEDDSGIAGFCWVKVHRSGRKRSGEIYVIGVHPRVRGLGLAGVLVSAGLEHMAGVGCRRALLYVDDSSEAAKAIFGSRGFVFAWADCGYVTDGAS